MAKVDADYGPVHNGEGINTLSVIQAGTIPTAEEGRLLAAGLNHLATGRLQVLFSHSSDIGTVSNFDHGSNSEITGYRARFITSLNARELVVILVVPPAPSNGTTTEPYVWCQITDSAGTVTVTDKRRSPGRAPAADLSADDLGVLAIKIPVEGGVWYDFFVAMQNRATVASCTVFEAVQSRGLDTDEYELVDTTKIAAHLPILSETIQHMKRVAHSIWRAPRILAMYSAENHLSATQAGGTTSGTASNAFDSSITSAGADSSPGFYPSLTAEDGVVDTGAGDASIVPVIFNACAYTASGGSGVVELRNGGNSIKATIDVSTDGRANVTPTWLKASCLLDTSDTKLEVFLRSPSGQAVRLAAANVIARHPVDPRDIEGLAAWYRADDLSALSYGANVSTWPDFSGHGYDLTAGSSPPTFENVTTRGQGVRFSGAAGCYLSHSDPGTAAYRAAQPTIFVVCKADDSTPTARQAVIGYGNPAGAGSRYEYGIQTDGDVYAGFNGAPFSVAAYLFATPYPSRWGAVSIHTWRAGNPTFSYGFNGNRYAGINTFDTATFSGNAGLYVGCEGATSPHLFDGEIYEVLVYDRALTASEASEVEHYLAVKWQLTEN